MTNIFGAEYESRLLSYNALVKEAGVFTRSILNALLYFGG